ncbi:MAG: pre-peptidase C-terminal domain-containing protein, partial [Pirellulaceae bacterium]|nr:pre-peptidase C-terminal domain-containing protein [Pirellulaceae bacterium]
AAGRYVIAVGEFDFLETPINAVGDPGGVTGNAPDFGDTYRLQVSVENHPLFFAAEVETNDSLATAQNVDGEVWTVNPDFNIGDASGDTSTVLPHISLRGTVDGTLDYYEFTVANDGERGIFDIDFAHDGTPGSFDSALFIYDLSGALLASNDTALVTSGRGGSLSDADAFIDFTFASAGTYVVGVGDSGTVGAPGGMLGTTPATDAAYTLQISIENHALGGVVLDTEPNDSRNNAQNLDNEIWTTQPNSDIGDALSDTSTTIPHLTIEGTGNGSFDYYSFTVTTANSRGIFDVDRGETGTAGSVDTELFLFDSDGNQLAANDVSPFVVGGSGSTSSEDAFIEHVFGTAGTYVVAVAESGSFAFNGNLVGNPLDIGDAYTLQVSLENHPTVGVDNLTISGDVSNIKTYKDLVRIINHTITDPGPLGLETALPGDEFGSFFSAARGVDNDIEGLYVDDVTIGFAERGEMVVGAGVDTNFISNRELLNDALNQATLTPPPHNDILVGEYQLEIRRGPEFVESGMLLESFDTNERLNQAVTVIAPMGSDLADGQQFTLSDGTRVVTFEFADLDLDDGNSAGTMTVGFRPAEPNYVIAQRLVQAINSAEVQNVLKLTAGLSDGVVVAANTFVPLSGATSHRVELHGNAVGQPGSVLDFGDIEVEKQGLGIGAFGDSNRFRDQGQVLIESNVIRDAAEFNLVVDAGQRSRPDLVPLQGSSPHPGAARHFNDLNYQSLAPGVTVFNNVIARGGLGGIRFSGDGLVGQTESVPFGRIFNNTIVGAGGTGTGIDVNQNASPTMLNNILADLATGISIDSSSTSSVLGGTLYQDNGANTSGTGLGSFAIDLPTGEPLFVDPVNSNFYLASDSLAIDSSLDSLLDRAAFVNAKAPLGISESPILAPNFDQLGQLRSDDPTVATPAGQGSNVFKDRGALDAIDKYGPRGFILDPLDNDAPGVDLDPALDVVLLDDPDRVTQFVIQLVDDGAGIDDLSVTSDQFTLTRNGQLLSPDGVDYFFFYNSATKQVIFEALTEYALDGRYEIVVNNDADSGLVDIAGNPIEPNQLDGATKYTILLSDAENDEPFNIIPGDQSTEEDLAIVLSTSTSNAIQVSDPDAILGSNELEVTLVATHGQMTLSTLEGLSFSVGDGSDDGAMTFRGAIPDINTALDGLTLLPSTDFNSTASSGVDEYVTIEVLTNDLGNATASGTVALTDPGPHDPSADVVRIFVNAINDPVVHTVPSSQTIDEDVPLEFSIANGNAIAVADVDASEFDGTGLLQVTLTATSTVTLVNPVGLTFLEGDGDADTTVTFEGTVTNINNALNGLVYTPTQDFNSDFSGNPGQLTITTTDFGNTGDPGPQTTIDTIEIYVDAVNDAPQHHYPSLPGTDEDTPLPFQSHTVVTDLGSGQSVQFELTAQGAATVNVSTDDLGDVGPASVAVNGSAIDVVLNSFTSAATLLHDFNTDGLVEIEFRAAIAGAQSNGNSITFTKEAGNSLDPAPLIIVNSLANHVTFVLNDRAGFKTTADDLLLALANDVAASALVTAQLTTDPTTGSADIATTTAPTTLFLDGGIGPATAQDFVDAINQNAEASALVTASQLSGDSSEDVTSPMIGALIDITLAGSAIHVSDVDNTEAGVGEILVMLTSTNGTLTVNGVTDTVHHLQGTLENVNEELNTLVFSPDLNFNGLATIEVVSNDNGNVGQNPQPGVSDTDIDIINIVVHAINDPP